MINLKVGDYCLYTLTLDSTRTKTGEQVVKKITYTAQVLGIKKRYVEVMIFNGKYKARKTVKPEYLKELQYYGLYGNHLHELPTVP